MATGKKDETVKDASKAMTDLMAQYQKMGTNAMSFMGGDWMERMSDMGAEMLQFYTQRMQEDAALYQKLMQCRDLKEMHDIQGEFLQRAIDRYTEETGKIFEMGSGTWTKGK